MPQVIVRGVLRAVAIAIAVTAAIDPALTVTRSSPQPVVVAQLTASGATVQESAIRAALPNAVVTSRQAAHGRLPCGPGEACLVVADGSIEVDIPEDLGGPIAFVRTGLAVAPNVAVRSVTASATQHAAGSGSLRVLISGDGMKGRRTDVRVSDAGALIGTASHDWTADGEVSLEIPWWPLGPGARSLHVSAVPADDETTTIDNAVEAGVNVTAARTPVLVFDARPSWASTFVRRALEDDRRFRVEHRVGLGRALAAGTRASRLDARSLDEAAVVIAGGLESLAATEVALLERFVRTRGGTLILLPDRGPGGAAARLFQGRWTEHLEATVSPAGPLRVSESLRLTTPSPFDVVLASVKENATVVVSPAGNGRFVISGALDAWRYRADDDGAFDRFWRTVVLESAAVSGTLSIEFERAVTRPAAEVPIMVRHRRMDYVDDAALSATVTCGELPATSLRLWPAGQDGVFTGTVAIVGERPCEVAVAVDNGPVAVAGIAVTNGATRSVSEVLTKLERAAASTGGVAVSAGQAAAAAASLATPGREESVPVRPMQSPWWMFPFVTCLGVEWWLRRRNGLR